jgi:hypothetical protein
MYRIIMTAKSCDTSRGIVFIHRPIFEVQEKIPPIAAATDVRLLALGAFGTGAFRACSLRSFPLNFLDTVFTLGFLSLKQPQRSNQNPLFANANMYGSLLPTGDYPAS